jgi:uncharacterized protein
MSRWSNRRAFLRQLGMMGLVAGGIKALSAVPQSAGISPFATSQVPARVIKNRRPLATSAFYHLPLGSIRPAGWLRRQLEIQADGLGGHLDETWADVGPNSGWLGGTGEAWERGPYFLDGIVPLAYLLDDPRLKAKAQKYVDWILNNTAASGMIGPKANDDWWPRMVAVKALAQYQEATHDPRVIPVLERYFAYQLDQLPKRPLRDWGKFRAHDEIMVVLWLYNRTGNQQLLDLARLLHRQSYDWQALFANFPYKATVTAEFLNTNNRASRRVGDLELSSHGVNNAMAIKVSPVSYLLSHSGADRSAVHRQLAALDMYHGLPNGMFSCDEHLGGLDPSHGSELCSVVEYMFSLEQSLAILGESSFGDRLERLAFNALPGAFTDTMWAHQYDQQPNQVECSLHRRPWTTNGPESNLFGLEPNFGCCTANFHQGWPKFTASLFMLSDDDSLVAAAYSPCEVETTVRGVPIQVREETEYPFRGTVRIALNPASPLTAHLMLRIPGWAKGAIIQVNGNPEPAPEANTFARVKRVWNLGDVVTITFPLEPRTSCWFNQSIAIERGPLVFSYPIGESWVKLADRGLTADWQVFPTSAWNYALALDAQEVANAVSLTEAPIVDKPFTANPAPVTLTVKARKVTAWRPEDGAANPLPPSPVSSGNPEEAIPLVPYAAAKLRITAFPQLKPNSKNSDA